MNIGTIIQTNNGAKTTTGSKSDNCQNVDWTIEHKQLWWWNLLNKKIQILIKFELILIVFNIIVSYNRFYNYFSWVDTNESFIIQWTMVGVNGIVHLLYFDPVAFF